MSQFTTRNVTNDGLFRLRPYTRWRFVKFCRFWYGVDGYNPPLVRHTLVAEGAGTPCEFRAMGLPWPDIAPTIVGAKSEGGVYNTYLRMAYSFYDPQTGRESKLSPWSNTINAQRIRIAISGFQFPPPGAYKLRLYANSQASPYRAFFVTEIPFVLSLVVDWSEDTLGFERDDEEGGLPPVTELIAAAGSRLYMAGSIEKEYESQGSFTKGSKEFVFKDYDDFKYDFPGKYLIGEHLIVEDYPDRRDVVLAIWDDVRWTGRLQYEWEEATGNYDFTMKRLRPAVFWSGFFPGGAELPESWDTENHVLFLPCEDSEQVTGLVGWGTPGVASLVAFSRDRCWITTTRHEPFQKMETETGTLSPDTVHIGHKGLLYWLGSDGQMYAHNRQDVDRVSKEFQQTLAEDVDDARLGEAMAVYDPKTQRQFWWLPTQGGGKVLYWMDYVSGQTFRSTLDVERAWRYYSEGETYVLVKIGADYFILGYLPPAEESEPLVWESGKVKRPPYGLQLIGRMSFQFTDATDEEIIIKIVDEDGEVVEQDVFHVEQNFMESFFRVRTGAFQLRLESSGKNWALRNIDMEVYPVGK